MAAQPPFAPNEPTLASWTCDRPRSKTAPDKACSVYSYVAVVASHPKTPTADIDPPIRRQADAAYVNCPRLVIPIPKSCAPKRVTPLIQTDHHSTFHVPGPDRLPRPPSLHTLSKRQLPLASFATLFNSSFIFTILREQSTAIAIDRSDLTPSVVLAFSLTTRPL